MVFFSKPKISKIILSLVLLTTLIPKSVLAWDSVGIGGHFSNREIPYAISTDVPSNWVLSIEEAAQTWTDYTVCSLPRQSENLVTVYAYDYGYDGSYGVTYWNPGQYASIFTGGNIQLNTYFGYESDFSTFIVKHEFGHILSLDHVSSYTTMYNGAGTYSYAESYAEAFSRDLLPSTLASDDINGVNTIYANVPN